MDINNSSLLPHGDWVVEANRHSCANTTYLHATIYGRSGDANTFCWQGAGDGCCGWCCAGKCDDLRWPLGDIEFGLTKM